MKSGRETEREGENKINGVTLILRGDRNMIPTLNVPVQCLFVLLVSVRSGEDKALGSENGDGSGCGLCYEQRREIEQGEIESRHC
jgi:hypothetical protein